MVRLTIVIWKHSSNTLPGHENLHIGLAQGKVPEVKHAACLDTQCYEESSESGRVC